MQKKQMATYNSWPLHCEPTLGFELEETQIELGPSHPTTETEVEIKRGVPLMFINSLN